MDLNRPTDSTTADRAMPAGDLAARFAGRQPDAEMAAVLRAMIDADSTPIAELSAREARKQPTPADAVKALLKKRGESTDPEAVGDVDNRSIDGPGGDIDIRIYKPASAEADTRLPVVLYIHGGGWVIADLDTYDASARAITNAAHCIVVSTHYRQGPEHTFPAAHEDVYTAYTWTLANAAELGGDPARVAVVGESAGGNMAAVVCMNARDEGTQLPVHQVLVYPVADYGQDTASYREMQDSLPLNAPMMGWFFGHYLGENAAGHAPAISLVDADLAGLPPATVINAELGPLRSEGEELARKLQAAGVRVSQRTYDGVTHEFFGMAPLLSKARDAQQFAASALRSAFGD